jgi:pimeloyl-ACP methyl ester carboxylesterase
MPTPPLAYWVHDLSPFLVRFTETVGVRYYGLAYLAGFAAAWWLVRSYGKRGLTTLNAEQAGDYLQAEACRRQLAELDTNDDTRQLEALAAAGATLVELPAAGHLCNIDSPDAFNAALRAQFARG